VLTALTLLAFPIGGGPLPRKAFFNSFDQIAWVCMSDLFVRSPMNAGQDGFRDEGSKQMRDPHGGPLGNAEFLSSVID
jgi:hypothetical protein